MNVRSTAQPGKDLWKVGSYEVGGSETNVIIPHNVFENATEFLGALKPTFFEHFNIKIVEADGPTCFSSAVRMAWTTSAALLVAMATLALSSN